MVEFLFEPQFFSVKSFVPSKTKSSPFPMEVSLLMSGWLAWVLLPQGRDTGWSQRPHCPAVSSTSSPQWGLSFHVWLFVEGLFIELLTVILFLGPGLCVPSSWKGVWYREESRSYEAKKAILLLRCLVFIGENSGLSHWMLLEEEWADELYCSAFKRKNWLGWKGGKETGGPRKCQILLSITHLDTEPEKGGISLGYGGEVGGHMTWAPGSVDLACNWGIPCLWGTSQGWEASISVMTTYGQKTRAF